MFMFRRASAVVVALALTLVACSSEHARIATYFDEAQSIAERMVAASTTFESIVNAQENPMEWSDEAKQQLSETLDALAVLRDDAQGMSVPEAFKDVHPLLLQSIDNMIGAIEIIQDISNDASLATMEKADEMTKKAEEGERLANEYVTQLEKILQEQYPELVVDE